MNKWLLFLLVAGLLVSCDKVKKTEKTVTGKWSVYQYQFTAPTGLVYYFESEGRMDFGSCGGSLCDYTIHIDYINQNGNPGQKYENGQIEFTDETSFLLHRNNPDGTVTTLTYGRILLMTKDDIVLHFTDEAGLHEFILQK